MDNKLTTKDAITVLRNLQDWLYFSSMNGGTKIQREAIDVAIEAIRSEPHWIPVTERLPELGTNVLTFIEPEKVHAINHLYDKREWFYDGVVAWMPLPEPYKEVTT